jgi:hypothetical protein
MRWVMFALAGTALAAATPALADSNNAPTLHGFCSLANSCSDNGTNTPTGVNPPQFGFAASGGSATGTLLIDILLPDNLAAPSSFTISGASTGTASLFSSTPWTSGQLDSYLGISASPANPIGAFLPTTQTYDAAATGFYVYQANLGTVTLPGTSAVGALGQDAYLMLLGQNLYQGSYIVGFLDQNGSYGATANSGAILETKPPVPEPATWAMMLLGFAGIGFAVRRARTTKPAIA